MYPSGSAAARIHSTPKMHNFFSSDLFPKLRQIVWSIGAFNYNFASVFCDLLSPIVPNNYSFKDTFYFVSQINPIQDGVFLDCLRMVGGGGGLPKIFHTYPAMIKLGRVIPYPKKIQKVYESRDRIFELC